MNQNTNVTTQPQIQIKQTSIPQVLIKDIKDTVKIGFQIQFKGMVSKFQYQESKDKTSKFAILEIKDKHTQVECKIWQQALSLAEQNPKTKEILTALENFTPEKPLFIAVLGRKKEYGNKIYIDVERMKILEHEILDDYLEASKIDANYMYDYILSYGKSIREPYCKIIESELEKNKENFMTAPGSKKFHDNFKSGLLEHTYKMLKIFVEVSNLYSNIDKDIMIFLIILHDFEKINSYTLLPSIELTLSEQLVGHTSMGVIKTFNLLKEHNVPDETIAAILNALLSHQGVPEWGAVVAGRTIEATILHHIDNLVAQTSRISQEIDRNKDKEGRIKQEMFFVKYF